MKAFLDPPRVSRCGQRQARQIQPCPKRWDALRSLPGEPLRRHCETCDQTVTWAITVAQFEALSARGACVAVSTGTEALDVQQTWTVGRTGSDFDEYLDPGD